MPPPLLKKKRLPGLSFVIRARNEADALFRNFIGLREIKVPHEIVVILHRCTDVSKDVAEAWRQQGLPVRIIEDNTPISRAGYETLITPVDHPNSLPEYYRRSFAHAEYNWLLKWDADFVPTTWFVDYVNRVLVLDDNTPRSYRLGCALGDTVVCQEEYMFNTCRGYGKYFCWEHCLQEEPHEITTLDMTCMFSGSPVLVKEYWRESPWFLQPDTYDEELAVKYAKLVDILGPEPAGFARSNNPEFRVLWARIVAVAPELERHGIYTTR